MFRQVITTVCLISTFAANAALGQELTDAKRSDFVSDASFIVGTYAPTSWDHTPKAMSDAAMAFLNSLTKDQQARAKHKLDSPERQEWTNLPAPVNAGGIRLGDLNEAQTKSALELMAKLFSQHGYWKMRNIMLADDQLLRGGRPRNGFGTENFSIVIFGEPSDSKPWAFQLDGHHVGVNVSLEGDKLTMSPSFIGTQPQTFKLGGKAMRPLTGEIDLAYEFANSLSDEQRKKAIIRNRRGRIATGPGNDFQVPSAKGIAGSELNDDQKKAVLKLIKQWVNDLPPTHAKQRLAQIEKEMDQLRFAWNGATEVGSDISYIIQSPSLIIEYACQDLGGDPQQHLHTIYRNPQNEYGLQIGRK